VADVDHLTQAAVPFERLDDARVTAAGVVDADDVRIRLEGFAHRGVGDLVGVPGHEAPREDQAVVGIGEVLREADGPLAVREIGAAMAQGHHGAAAPPERVAHEVSGRAARALVVDADIQRLAAMADVRDQQHDRNVPAIDRLQSLDDPGMVLDHDDQGLPLVREALDPARHLVGGVLLEEGPVQDDRLVERRGQLLDREVQAGEEGRFRPDENHPDPNGGMVEGWQGAVVTELVRRDDHTPRGLLRHVSPSVQDPLHGRGPDARFPCDVPDPRRLGPLPTGQTPLHDGWTARIPGIPA